MTTQGGLQSFQLRAQAAYLLFVVLDYGVLLREQRSLLLDEFVALYQLFSQHRILFSQPYQLFFDRHGVYSTRLDTLWQVPSEPGQLPAPLNKVKC